MDSVDHLLLRTLAILAGKISLTSPFNALPALSSVSIWLWGAQAVEAFMLLRRLTSWSKPAKSFYALNSTPSTPSIPSNSVSIASFPVALPLRRNTLLWSVCATNALGEPT